MSSTEPNAATNKCIGPTAITTDHFQLAFREYLKDDKVKVDKVDSSIIAAGEGFTSFILRLQVQWNEQAMAKHGAKLPKSVILKALSQVAVERMISTLNVNEDDGVRQMMIAMIARAHKTECMVYELFDGHTVVSPVPIPGYYSAWNGDQTPSRPPMLLIEDLGDRGRVLGDPSLSLTYPQLLQLADALANLHYWCMTTDVKWTDKFRTFRENMGGMMTDSFKPMMEEGMKKAKLVHADIMAKLDEGKIMRLMSPEEYFKSLESHKPWTPDVIVHGDFWANNVLFNKLPDGSMGDQLVAFIDWQAAFIGNPMYDFARVMTISVDPEIREAHFEAVVRKYYDTLVDKLGPSRVPKEMTFERMFSMAQYHTAAGCLFILFMHGTLEKIFASGDGPDGDMRRERMLRRARGGVEYAMTQLDIAADK